MIGANSIWGLMAPIAKATMAGAVIGPLVLTNLRIVGAALLFWLVSPLLPREKVSGRDLLWLAGASLCGIITNQGCYIFGVGYTSPGEAAIITTTMPLWVMVLAALILKEPITGKKIGGIVAGAAGALLLVLSGRHRAVGGDNPMLGDMLVLTGQLSYALYLTLYKNFIRKYSVMTLMKWMFTFGALMVLPFTAVPVIHTQWCQASAGQLWGAAYVVVLGTFAAYICMMIGQKNLRPTLVSVYNYFQPLVATMAGIYMGVEIFSVHKILAVCLIVFGVYLVTISKARNQNHAPVK